MVSSCFKFQTVWNFNQLELRYRGKNAALSSRTRPAARAREKVTANYRQKRTPASCLQGGIKARQNVSHLAHGRALHGRWLEMVSSCFKFQTVWNFNQLELRYRGKNAALSSRTRPAARAREKVTANYRQKRTPASCLQGGIKARQNVSHLAHGRALHGRWLEIEKRSHASLKSIDNPCRQEIYKQQHGCRNKPERRCGHV